MAVSKGTKVKNYVFLVGLFLASAGAFAQTAQYRTTCNGCDDFAMAQAARGLGPGEHLVLNVTGQSFRKYEVFCAGAGGGGGTHVRATGRNWCNGELNPVEQSATAEDYAAFAQIKDALTPDGGIEKIVTVHVQSPPSVYALGEAGGPGANAQWELRQGLYSQLPPATLSEQAVRWLGQTINLNTAPEIVRVQIFFPDGSQIRAKIDLSVLAGAHWVTPGAGETELILASALDKELRPVVGLNWVPPSAPNHGEMLRWPSNGPGFEDLMQSHGFPTRPMTPHTGVGSGSSGCRHACSMRMIDEDNPAAGSETVCVRSC